MPFAGKQPIPDVTKMSRRAFLLGTASASAGAAAVLLLGTGAEAAVVNVKDYGAAGDGVQNDAPEIQNAINKAPPGSTVYFPAGDYALYDALYPRSGVNIEFQPGARVIQRSAQHIFWFRGVSNIITRNLRMRHEGTKTLANPMLWDGASYLTHYDTTIERTDAWNGHVKAGSHHITIDGYAVLNAETRTTNYDEGIAFVDCHDITLRKFDIRTNDNAIAFQSRGGTSGVYNITIEDGYVYSRLSGGIAFGTELAVSVRDCRISNVVARDTRVPIYFRGTDANKTGEVYRITFEDISIFDNLGRTHSAVFFHTASTRAGKVHDIDFNNLTYWGPMEFDLLRIQRSRRIRFRNVVCDALRMQSPQFTTRNRYGAYLESTQDCLFESFGLSGMRAPAMLNGSSTRGNVFVGFDKNQVLVENGAELQYQSFTTAAAPTPTPTRTATPTPTATPRPGVTVAPLPPGWIW